MKTKLEANSEQDEAYVGALSLSLSQENLLSISTKRENKKEREKRLNKREKEEKREREKDIDLSLRTLQITKRERERAHTQILPKLNIFLPVRVLLSACLGFVFFLLMIYLYSLFIVSFPEREIYPDDVKESLRVATKAGFPFAVLISGAFIPIMLQSFKVKMVELRMGKLKAQKKHR